MMGLKSLYVQFPSTTDSHIWKLSISTTSDPNPQADKILALTSAANVELEPIWASLLAKALEGKNVKELLSNVGAGGAGPAPGVGAGGATGGAPAAAAEKEEEKKEEEKEESDDDMVCSLHFAYNDFCLTDYLFRASVFSINCLSHVAVQYPACPLIQKLFHNIHLSS